MWSQDHWLAQCLPLGLEFTNCLEWMQMPLPLLGCYHKRANCCKISFYMDVGIQAEISLLWSWKITEWTWVLSTPVLFLREFILSHLWKYSHSLMFHIRFTEKQILQNKTHKRAEKYPWEVMCMGRGKSAVAFMVFGRSDMTNKIFRLKTVKIKSKHLMN